MSEVVVIQHYRSSFGELILGSYQDQLCLCDWRYRKMRNTVDQRIQSGLNAKYEEGTSEVAQETIRQLEEYASGNLREFDLPLQFVGTEFQKRVWEALCRIPFGQTSTYLDLSRELGNEKAIRAVASANGANAISIVVPCHRIIGSDGSMVGYAGGTPVKKKLLQLEGVPAAGQFSMFG